MALSEQLLAALINKNVVRNETEITILRSGKDLAGSLSIQSTENLEVYEVEESSLKCVSTIDGRKYRIQAHHILKIDGMDPVRLARVYNLREDGSSKPTGKKRGRKPNSEKNNGQTNQLQQQSGETAS